MIQGQIVYHKLTGQGLIVIEEINEDYDLDDNETVECRYRDSQGNYQSTDFYGAELTEKPPVTYSGPGSCNGNCVCKSRAGGGGAPSYYCSCCDKSGGGGATGSGR